MNLTYRYVLRSDRPYERDKQYVLLKNLDSEPVYLANARVNPGECFVLEEEEAQNMLSHIIYDKKVVIIDRISPE